MNENEIVDYEVDAKKLNRFLEHAQSRLRKTSQKIIEDLSDFALEEMVKNYSAAEYQAGGEEMGFGKSTKENEIKVSMIGEQSWYSEFGTGTRGALSPHPLKARFELNPYNSGEKIKTATKRIVAREEAIRAGIEEGDLFWIYVGKDGETYFTKGIPAQKIVYNAGMAVQKKIPEIVEKRIKEMFSLKW